MSCYSLKTILSAVLFSLLIAGDALAVPQPHALPMGPEVIHGNVSIANIGNATLQINNSPNAIINWQSFSLNSGETTQFIQQNQNSSILNRVVGQDPSSILGAIQSNGRVFLINPNGVVFGSDANIDTAGLIVSSLAISNDDFTNGRFNFQGQDGGKIVNNGYIRAGKNGEVVFIAPQVENNGIIEAEDGTILLAAGRSISLASLDAEGISLNLTAPGDKVLNLGKLIADRGAVGLFADVIKHSGTSQANALIKGEDGQIKLVAQTQIELDSDSKLIAESGDIAIQSDGETFASGKISTNGIGDDAGQISILGEQVKLSNALVTSSAKNGGGEIRIGGDFQGKGELQTAEYTSIDSLSRISADALNNGDGGTIIVWADNRTEMHAAISAIGGSETGNGGFVEVSGKKELQITGLADLSAANGNFGQLLLDPDSVHVVSNESQIESDSNIINIDWIEDSLDAASVNIVTGSQDIVIDTPINFDSGNTLVLNAGQNIDIRQPITASNNSQVVLNAAGNVINSSGEPILISADSVNIASQKDLALLDSLVIEAEDTIYISATNDMGLGAKISANNISLSTDNGSISQYPNASINSNGNVQINAGGDVSLAGTDNSFSVISVNTANASEGGNVNIIHDESVAIVSFGITTPVGVDVNIEPYRAPADVGTGSGINDSGITDIPIDNGTSSTSPGTGISDSGATSSEDPNVLGTDTDPVSLLLASADIMKYRLKLDGENEDEYKSSKRRNLKKSKQAILHCTKLYQ